MNMLDTLIEKLCPDGVEFRKINDVCKNICSGGTPNSKNKSYYNGNIPWLRTQEVNFCAISETDMKITEEGLANSSAKWIPENSVIVAMYGATVGKVAYTTIPLTTNQACCNLEVDKEKALFKFVYYWLSDCYDYIKSLGQGSQTNINAQIVKDLKIPLPPLEVQAEIVRILDSFTEYIEELNAELSARRKQYAYYRDSLLDFGEEVERVLLSDIASYSKTRISADKLNKNNYISVENLLPDRAGKINAVSVPQKGRYIYYPIGTVLIGNIRPYLRKIWLSDCEGGTNGDVLPVVINDKSKMIPEFLFYVLSSENFFYYNIQNSKGAKMPRGDKNAIMNFPVPVPPIEEQERIAAILDKFDSLCNELTEGLPAEIEARRRQYEYYRDRLLTFREKNVI